MSELVKLSAAEMAAKIKSKEVSSRELVEAHLEVIEAAEPSIKAFLKVSGEQALEQADAFDSKSDEEKSALPELAGVPIAIKDMIVTKGIETTAASKILEGWVPPYDATVIEKLKAAGMPLLGKTNLDEFAQGSSTEHSAYQTTHNPWIPSAFRVVPAVAPQLPWPHSKLRSLWAPIPAVPSGSRAR